jgi:hypothetical protein
MDPYNSGDWMDCVGIHPSFDSDFFKNVHLGFSGKSIDAPIAAGAAAGESYQFTINTVTVFNKWDDAHDGKLLYNPSADAPTEGNTADSAAGVEDGSSPTEQFPDDNADLKEPLHVDPEEDPAQADPKTHFDQLLKEAEGGGAGDGHTEDALKKMKLHEWEVEERIKLLEKKYSDEHNVHLAELETKIGKQGDKAAIAKVKEIEKEMAATALEGLLERVEMIDMQIHNLLEEKLRAKVLELEDQVRQASNGKHTMMKKTLDEEVESRLSAVEEKVKAALTEQISARGYGHEDTKTDENEKHRRQHLNEAMANIQKRYDAAGASHREGLLSHSASVKRANGGGGGSIWLYCFIVLAVVGVAAGGFFYTNYRKITKSHLI